MLASNYKYEYQMAAINSKLQLILQCPVGWKFCSTATDSCAD